MFNRAINAVLLNNLLEFEESLTRSFQPLNKNNIQENFRLPLPINSPDLQRNKNDEILNWPHILIPLG